LQGLGRKFDIGGLIPSVKLKVCLDFNECRMFSFSCRACGVFYCRR